MGKTQFFRFISVPVHPGLRATKFNAGPLSPPSAGLVRVGGGGVVCLSVLGLCAQVMSAVMPLYTVIKI